MELHTGWIEYRVEGGTVAAYLARPAAAHGPLPGLLVIQEMWGVDDHIEDLTRRYAESGYAALAPDLFSHGAGRPPALGRDRVEAFKRFMDSVGPSVWGNPAGMQAALAQLPAEEGRRVAETQQSLMGGAMRDGARHLAALRAAAAWLREQPFCAGRPLGSVGYCMGGGLSAQLAAADAGLSAAAIYYGASLPDDRIAAVGCPVLGMYGGDDLRITDTVPAFAAAMAAAGKAFTHRIYPGAPHAFFNDTRRSYRPDVARDAWARTLLFFTEHLG